MPDQNTPQQPESAGSGAAPADTRVPEVKIPAGAPRWQRLAQASLLVVALVTLFWMLSGDEETGEPRAVTPRGNLAADELATIEIFQRASPSVVFITTTERVEGAWFRRPTSIERGTGSGFVWDDAGHIVTNHHVVDGAERATVRLNDGRSYTARLVGASQLHDLAVLKIDVPFDRPPPVPLGTSADMLVGQKVFAIGNPFGLDYTLTSGLVSALDRSLPGAGGISIEHLIQTDAAINPGNSGGPLLDSAGRLIGINTAIFSPSGAYAGIGFAVPVDAVNRVVPEIIEDGRYVRPTIGIRVNSGVNRRLSRDLGIEGVVVLDVDADSPAARAGLRGTSVSANGDVDAGDVIVAIDGAVVDSVGRLLAVLEGYAVGDEIELDIWRDGDTVRLSVVLQGS